MVHLGDQNQKNPLEKSKSGENTADNFSGWGFAPGYSRSCTKLLQVEYILDGAVKMNVCTFLYNESAFCDAFLWIGGKYLEK